MRICAVRNVVASATRSRSARDGAGLGASLFVANAMAPGAWHSASFEPALLLGQIFAMQSLMYISLGLWMLVLNGLSGNPTTAVGLEHFFSHRRACVSPRGGAAACRRPRAPSARAQVDPALVHRWLAHDRRLLRERARRVRAATAAARVRRGR